MYGLPIEITDNLTIFCQHYSKKYNINLDLVQYDKGWRIDYTELPNGK